MKEQDGFIGVERRVTEWVENRGSTEVLYPGKFLQNGGNIETFLK